MCWHKVSVKKSKHRQDDLIKIVLIGTIGFKFHGGIMNRYLTLITVFVTTLWLFALLIELPSASLSIFFWRHQLILLTGGLAVSL